jgi:hypothetical protein
MGKMLEKYDQGNIQKKTKKGCMQFYHSSRSSILEVVSIRSKITREEETSKMASKGQKKKR